MEVDRFQLQKEICRLSTTKLNCGKSIAELSEYKGVSLWWFHYYTFTRKVYEKLNGSTDNIPHDYRTIKQVGELVYCPALYYVWNAMERIYYPNQENRNNRKIIFIEIPRYWINSKDTFFGSIKEKLLADGKTEILSTFSVGCDIHQIKTMLDIMKHEKKIKHRPLEYYQSLDTNICEHKARIRYSKIWEIIKDDKVLHELLSFHGMDMHKIMISELEHCFKTALGKTVLEIETVTRMVQKETPSCIVVVDEGGRPHPYVMGCKQTGKPIISIQHGTISSQITFWCGSERFSMLPDITTVYGKTYQDILIQTRMYRETDIVITGNHRDDVIFQKRSKEQICNSIGLNKEKKILLWTFTMFYNPPDENRNYINTMSNAVKKLDVQLVISLHPSSTKESEQQLRSMCFSEIIIVHKTDINDLIYICDALITKKSTTAITAMVMGKPVIIMNFSGQPDMQPYVSGGLAAGVYHEKDLIPAIETVLSGQQDTEIKKKRDELLNNLVYIQDGKATNRIVDAINEDKKI